MAFLLQASDRDPGDMLQRHRLQERPNGAWNLPQCSPMKGLPAAVMVQGNASHVLIVSGPMDPCSPVLSKCLGVSGAVCSGAKHARTKVLHTRAFLLLRG